MLQNPHYSFSTFRVLRLESVITNSCFYCAVCSFPTSNDYS